MSFCKATNLILHRIIRNFLVKDIFVFHGTCISKIEQLELLLSVLVLTILVPLKNEIRFLLIGNKISMQLKFRHTADARAQARVDCANIKTQERDAVKPRKPRKIDCILFSEMVMCNH